METKIKRNYTKPGIVYCDFVTGEMTGSQFMIDKIVAETEQMTKEHGELRQCPFGDTRIADCMNVV